MKIPTPLTTPSLSSDKEGDADWEEERFYHKKYLRFIFKDTKVLNVVQSNLEKNQMSISFIRHLNLRAWVQYTGIFFSFKGDYHDKIVGISHLQDMAREQFNCDIGYALTERDDLIKVSLYEFSDKDVARLMNTPFSFALKHLVEIAVN